MREIGLAALRIGALLIGLAVPAVAQSVVTGARPAPKLDFADAEMALARAVAGDPGLADLYGGNGLRPIFAR